MRLARHALNVTRRDTKVTTMRWNPWIGCLLAATAGLVGCTPKTNVSTTANVPAAYSHVYMSVQEVWFNTSATAPGFALDNIRTIPVPLAVPEPVSMVLLGSGLAMAVLRRRVSARR